MFLESGDDILSKLSNAALLRFLVLLLTILGCKSRFSFIKPLFTLLVISFLISPIDSIDFVDSFAYF